MELFENEVFKTKKPLKICILTNSFAPEFGAAAFRLSQMAKGLTDAGHQVAVLTALPNYPEGKIHSKYHNKLLISQLEDGITVRRHWLYATNRTSWLARFVGMFSLAATMCFSLPFLKKFAPDLLIVQCPPFALPLFSIFLAKFLKTRLILNFSDLWSRGILDLGITKNRFIGQLLERIERKLAQKADYCLAQSEEIKEYLQKSGQNNIILYRTGTDTTLFTPQKPNFFQKNSHLQENDHRLRIIYAGTLGLAHGLLSICKQLNFKELGAELHLYGNGFEREGIEVFLANHPHRGIILHKALNINEIAKNFSYFDVALVAQKRSIYGTVPAKLYEAMSAAIPILFHGGGEGAEIVKKSGCGLISNPAHIEQLKNNILIFKNLAKNELEKSGMNGRNLAVSQFDRKTQLEKLLVLIENLSLHEKNN